MKNVFTKGKLLGLVALTLFGIIILVQPAKADRYDHNEGYENRYPSRHYGWREHEVEARRWHRRHYVPAPGVVYAPPAVVYAPPPPPPGINLVIPLDFR